MIFIISISLVAIALMLKSLGSSIHREDRYTVRKTDVFELITDADNTEQYMIAECAINDFEKDYPDEPITAHMRKYLVDKKLFNRMARNNGQEIHY